MSKFKTPREKKLASLALDCRNAYGENDKASRRLIPRRKQQSHQALRRAAKRPLQNLSTACHEDVLEQADVFVKERELSGKLKAFRKAADAPVVSVLEYQRTGNWQRFTRGRV